ncbi:hypothetical protein CZP2022_138 [Vibrio phage C-ZP2022]|nr:hypothetical protein CZP2022_138 [Vibrio phage C-ZP2022]
MKSQFENTVDNEMARITAELNINATERASIMDAVADLGKITQEPAAVMAMFETAREVLSRPQPFYL